MMLLAQARGDQVTAGEIATLDSLLDKMGGGNERRAGDLIEFLTHISYALKQGSTVRLYQCDTLQMRYLEAQQKGEDDTDLPKADGADLPKADGAEEIVKRSNWVRHMIDHHDETLASAMALVHEEIDQHPDKTVLEVMGQIHARQHDSLDVALGHAPDVDPFVCDEEELT